MLRPESYSSSISYRAVLFAVGCTVIGGNCNPLLAVGLNYVDADEFINLTPASAITTANAADTLWRIRQDFGVGQGGVFTVYEASAEDAQQLTQKITGLTPGKNYDVYGVFVSDAASPPGGVENWTLRTGLTPGNLTLYSFWGNQGAVPVADSTPGLTAGAAVWDTLPPANKEGTLFTERPADILVNLLGKAGTIAANGAGEIDVFIDDLPNIAPNTGPRRTWFEGVAYTDAGTQIALTATVDRATGAITINNPTATPFQFKSYSLVSTSGELNANNWTKISGWDITATPDATSPFATNLTQTDPTMTGTAIAANGGSLTFGNVGGQKTPFPEDILIRLTRNDNEIAVIAPQYTGPVTTFTVGDFDTSGAINLVDFQTLLNNLHTNQTTLSPAGAHNRGDMNGDRIINFSDFAAFRTAYDAANGAGSFARLVPEPNTLGMLLVLTAASSILARRRVMLRSLALFLSCLTLSLTNSAFAIDIKVDIDSTRVAGSTVPGPIATQPGFTSWDLTNVGTAGSTIRVENVTFEIFGLNAANQSRVRLTGTDPNGGGGEFNSVLADFVFNEGADMRAIGLRISNLPVGMYEMQSWHHDFTIGTPENTQVEVRNQGEPMDPSQIVVPTAPWAETPLEFGVEVTAPNQVKEVIFRESHAGNRARLNAFTLFSDVPPPPLNELTLEVNTTTGAVKIVNDQTTSFDVSYYEIRSATGALNPTGWTSLDDAEGADPVGTGWDEAVASTANILSEVNLTSMQTFAPGNSSNLGNAFTPGGMQNLQFFYAAPGATVLRTGGVEYLTGPSGVDGDYNADGNVDAADYVVWRKTDGTQTTLPNDTTPGSVTTADYAVWRTNFGKSAPAGAGLASASAVPEPHALLLGLLAIMSAIWLRQQKTRC